MRLALLFSSLSFSFWLGGQSPSTEAWTLLECIEYAHLHNPGLQRTKLQAEIDRNDLQSARFDYLPGLSLGSNYFWNFGLNIDPVTNQISRETRQTANVNLAANWLVFDGGRKYNRIAQGRSNSMAAQYEYEAARNDLSLNVANAFLQILLNREIAEVAEEQMRLSRLQLERTTSLVEAGTLPLGEQYQLEAQQARDFQNLVAAKNAVSLSRLNLANLLQLEDPDQFDVVAPNLQIPTEESLLLSPAQVFASAVEHQPVIRGAQQRLQSQRQGIALARGGYLPSLSFIAQVGSNYSNQIPNVVGSNSMVVPIGQVASTGEAVFSLPQEVPNIDGVKPFGDQVGDNINEVVGINLQVPIFNRFVVRNAVQNAQIRTAQAELNLDQERNNLRQIIYQAHADAKASFRQYEAADLAVKSSRKAFDYAQERFNVGALNFVDFENAKSNLARARSEQAQAKYDFIFKVKVLEFYRSNQVTF